MLHTKFQRHRSVGSGEEDFFSFFFFFFFFLSHMGMAPNCNNFTPVSRKIKKAKLLLFILFINFVCFFVCVRHKNPFF